MFIELEHVFVNIVYKIYPDNIDDFSTRTVNRKAYDFIVFGRFIPPQLATIDWDVLNVVMELDTI